MPQRFCSQFTERGGGVPRASRGIAESREEGGHCCRGLFRVMFSCTANQQQAEKLGTAWRKGIQKEGHRPATFYCIHGAFSRAEAEAGSGNMEFLIRV